MAVTEDMKNTCNCGKFGDGLVRSHECESVHGYGGIQNCLYRNGLGYRGTPANVPANRGNGKSIPGILQKTDESCDKKDPTKMAEGMREI